MVINKIKFPHNIDNYVALYPWNCTYRHTICSSLFLGAMIHPESMIVNKIQYQPKTLLITTHSTPRVIQSVPPYFEGKGSSQLKVIKQNQICT